MHPELPSKLARLATHHGIVVSYHDIEGRVQHASTQGVLALLTHLGIEIDRPDDAEELLERARAEATARWVEPVTVVWQPAPPQISIARIPGAVLDDGRLRGCEIRVDLEDGTTLFPEPKAVPSGDRVLLELPPLALGRHRATIRLAEHEGATWLLCAPALAHPAKARCWGVFAPTYSLRNRDTQTGTLSELGLLADWTAGHGGGFVGTLPLLPSYLDRPYDPSPYAPISRLFWGDFYLDLPKLARAQHCEPALALLSHYSQLERAQVEAPERLIDYSELDRTRHRVLRELSRHFFANESPERAQFVRYLKDHGEVDAYARFRAVMANRQSYFRHWPKALQAQLRTTDPSPTETDLLEIDCHRYAQWRVHEQLAEVAKRARNGGAGLYLDLPVGTHPNGFDAWYHDDSFLPQTSAGAPPDPFFSKGQNWGFAPLHPHTNREQGYAYLQACLRNHMQVAEILRIDHVMGLHRIFCIPNGMSGPDGAYLRFHEQELYALTALESVRHRCTIVGEDLGTVPPEVRTEMSKRGLVRMYVGQFSIHDREPFLDPPPANSLASLNTHDMPPFAAFTRGLDIEERVALGVLSPQAARADHDARQRLLAALRNGLHVKDPSDLALLLQLLKRLSLSPAPYVLVSLEDLWLETAPQNVPGTYLERPNWRRRMAHGLETLDKQSGILAVLEVLNRREDPGIASHATALE